MLYELRIIAIAFIAGVLAGLAFHMMSAPQTRYIVCVVNAANGVHERCKTLETFKAEGET